MMYILDYYYLINHEKYCLVVEMDNTVDEVIEICSALSFLLEEITSPSNCLDDSCLLKCLEKFYDAKNVKDTIGLKILIMLQLPIEDMYQSVFINYDTGTDKAYIIDLFEAREWCCQVGGEKIMDKWLPKGKTLESLKNILLTENDTDMR